MTIFSIICKTAGIGMFSDLIDKKLSDNNINIKINMIDILYLMFYEDMILI